GAIRIPRSWLATLAAIRADSLFPVLEQADVGAQIELQSVPAGPILAPLLTPRAKQGSRATFAAEPVDPMLAVIRTERPQLEEGTTPSGMAGTVAVTAELSGTGAHPEVSLRGMADDLRIYQAHADSVEFAAVYVDSMLYLQRLDWREHGRGVHASGRVPMRLRANPAKTRLRLEPLWIEVEIPSVDLSLASLFTALIEDPSGNLYGRARLKGTPPDLFVEGDLSVNNGAFRIPLREERLSNVEARLHLDSLGVHIVEANGRFNDSGTAQATGWYRDPSRFQLQGTVRNGLVLESGNYNFLADADLEAAPIAVGDSTRPRLSGLVSVHEGAITMDLAKPGREKVLITPWLFDLDVVIPGNVRVIQPTSSVYVGSGRLQVHYDMPYWSLGGRVDVTSGHILVFNKNLRITEGTVEFLDTGTGPYPVLDISAETEIPDPEGQGPPVRIEVKVQGSPDPDEGLEITLSSPDPRNYSQADLVDLLTVGQVRSAIETGSATEPARGFLTGQVLNSLERELIREAPWLDVVEVSGGTDASDPIVISLRAVTEPQWSLRYSQELAATSGQEVALTYRISNLFFLNAAADRKRGGETTSTANETYTLDFRLRVDY
ncbi:MAG: translocation/assembly module TamB domain-containing protein, partial [Candidatus Eisenbacteria bacterium]|nr:translocation/assembly module TamB domain-containing protein [Candidatus Eisenbacteria bacterium]